VTRAHLFQEDQNVKLDPINKFFGALLAFIVMIFAVAQIWFPDMFEVDDFVKFAGTVAVIYAFVGIFSWLTGQKDEDASAQTDEKND